MRSDRFRSVIKQLAPRSVLRIHKNLVWSRIRKRYGQLSVAEAFSQTYQDQLWGNVAGERFFSGGGSLEEFTGPYVDWVARFVIDHKINTIVDLGCGDFRVGRRICNAVEANYIGVDIVPALIAHNEAQFGDGRISFKLGDIIEDELPNGELCLIRQVLQHLSNEQISQVLANCSKYPYLAVTEDVYNGPTARPNLDIMHGPDNRLFQHSGVFLDLEPFAIRTRNVLEIRCRETSSLIRTCLIEGGYCLQRAVYP
jgi:hypothetical protein